MLLPFSLAIEAASIAVLSARIGGRRFNILTGYFLLWAGIFLVVVWNPLRLRPVTGSAALILAVGMLAVLGGAVFAARWVRFHPGTYRAVGMVDPPIFRWTIGLTIASAGLGVAVLVFRDAVDAAAGGTAFGQLTAVQVRYYSVYGAADHAGIGTTLYSLAALIAAGGVVLGHHRRLGYLFTAYAIVMAAQNPSRTPVFYAALAALLTWLYYRPLQTKTRSAVRRGWHKAGVIGITLVCLFVYFQHEGALLEKSNPGQILSGTMIPVALISPTIYLTGSPEALSSALDDNLNPTEGEHGRTVWVVLRTLSLIDRGITAPNNVAQFVLIPYPYNTYTWVGDLWFDFGWPGVVLAGLLLGFVTVVVDDRARRERSAIWSWWVAAWGTILMSSIIGFEVFWLQTVLWVLVGPMVFGRPWGLAPVGYRRHSPPVAAAAR